MVNEVNNNIRIMQINERSVQNVKKLEASEKVAQADDKLALSEQVKQLSNLDSVELPVPFEQLAKLKQDIANGCYSVEHAKVADALLKRNIDTI